MRCVCGVDNFLLAVVAEGRDEKVVGQGAGFDLMGFHVFHPWAEDEGHKHHGKRAALRYAVWAAVGGT